MAQPFPRSKVLRYLDSRLSGISKVYTSNRPTSTDPAENFLVIDLPGTMLDTGAYFDSALRIDLFQKDRQGGLEATDKLETLMQSIMGLFPIVNKELRFRAISPRLVAGGGDDKGFHYLMIYATIIID